MKKKNKEKNLNFSDIEFYQKILAFKPTKLQEAFIKQIGKGSKTPMWWTRGSYKKFFANEFCCSQLKKMKVGQTFCLATIKGAFMFELKKIIKPQMARQSKLRGRNAEICIIDEFANFKENKIRRKK
ncbi:MAG: hypothetical protein HQ594_06120 [Candidatus Omnitrophica bacterium]|nr:hypothetical protein [Candidatus Omnitrophota bacterium]